MVVPGAKPVADKEDFSGTTAAERFGLSNVQSGYKFVADLTTKSMFVVSRVEKRPMDLTLKDFRDVRSLMTPSAQAWFTKHFDERATTSRWAIYGVAIYGWGQPKRSGSGHKTRDNAWEFRKDYPVTGIRVHDTEPFPANNGDLGLRSRVECTAHLINRSGKKLRKNCARKQTYYLKKDSAGKWRLDGWNADFPRWTNSPDNI